MRQLFVTDLDGTLLNPESRVSEESARIITSLSRQGALISVATARTPATVEPLLSQTFISVPIIVMTGAAMWSRGSQSYLDSRYIPSVTAAYILETCRAHGLRPLSYTLPHGSGGVLHAYFDGRPDVLERKFLDERSRLRLKRVHIDDPIVRGLPSVPDTVLVFCLGDTERIGAAASALRASGNCSVSSYSDIFNEGVSYLEVFAPGVSKAEAVMRLRKITGAERVTVFGDNLNDLPMMAVADVSVAVGNAVPQVREAAQVVIGTNAEDSVARYISEQYP